MVRSDSNKFRDLKASYDSRSKPTGATATSTAYQSKAGDLANMSSAQTRNVTSIAKSIDSVLETPAAKQPVRPLAKLRPSWIGPPRQERAATPGSPTMKQHVLIEYSSPGLQPPVFVFTSLSDPPWDAVEMQSKKKDDGEHVFTQVFDAEEGEYQYKFRLGPGDWWACDDSKPTVDDGFGNKNNLIAVKPGQSQPKVAQPVLDQVSTTKDQKQNESKPPAISMLESNPKPQPMMTPTHEEFSAPMPLLKHEIAASPHTKDQHGQLAHDQADLRFPLHDDEHTTHRHAYHTSPLLPHESLAPSSVEQEHAPLFRHESIGLGNNHYERPAVTASPVRSTKHDSPHSLHADEDIHHPSLEKFPTDHAGIFAHIHHTSTDLAEEETLHDADAHGSPASQALSESSVSVPSLASVRENEEEALEKIREAEEQEFEKEQVDGWTISPLRRNAPMTPPLTPEEPEDADFEPKVSKEKAETGETIIINIIDERKGWLEVLFEKVGGKGNAMAMAVGLLVIAAGISSLRFI